MRARPGQVIGQPRGHQRVGLSVCYVCVRVGLDNLGVYQVLCWRNLGTGQPSRHYEKRGTVGFLGFSVNCKSCTR